jgi:hypothetical protein
LNLGPELENGQDPQQTNQFCEQTDWAHRLKPTVCDCITRHRNLI